MIGFETRGKKKFSHMSRITFIYWLFQDEAENQKGYFWFLQSLKSCNIILKLSMKFLWGFFKLLSFWMSIYMSVSFISWLEKKIYIHFNGEKVLKNDIIASMNFGGESKTKFIFFNRNSIHIYNIQLCSLTSNWCFPI